MNMMSPISPVRTPVFADFSHTTVVPRISESITGRIMHEITLRQQVSGRLLEPQRKSFERAATAGWERSLTLKKQKTDPREIYMAWLRPFSGFLTHDDIRRDVINNWARNDHFDWIVREIAGRMGYTAKEKMPLTYVSGAITPMIEIALGLHFGDLTDSVVDVKINALDTIMKNGIFTGELGPIDPRIYLGAASYTGDYLIIGDHYMRQNPIFGNHLLTIFEPDGSCNRQQVLEQLDQYFPK